jgi:hypothetical protein
VIVLRKIEKLKSQVLLSNKDRDTFDLFSVLYLLFFLYLEIWFTIMAPAISISKPVCARNWLQEGGGGV